MNGATDGNASARTSGARAAQVPSLRRSSVASAHGTIQRLTALRCPLVAHPLTSHYASYYNGQSRWREIGAVDKVHNIVRLWEGPPPRILDIGCGEGAIAAEMAERQFGASYVGVDVSESAIEAARGRGLPGARFERFDGVRLPFEDHLYDLAVLSHVVEHLEHPRVMLAEAKRIAPHVFVEVPLELTARTPRDFAWTNTGHVNIYSRTVIRHLVQSSG